MWLYEDKVIEKIEDFPEDTYGFVYMTTHTPTGISYIGKKALFHNVKKKLTKAELAEQTGPGRKATTKVVQKESDWKTYWGSNKPLLEELKANPDDFERSIIQLAKDKKQLTYFETKYLFVYSVLEKPEEFYNDNILGKFYTKDFAS